MHAMILAAGFGERLGPLTLERPKALLPVLGRPVVGYVLDWLRRSGARPIVVNAHHLADEMDRALGEERDVRVLREERILGTGGGVKNALAHLGRETFVVVNGKILFEPDLGALLSAHERAGAEVTMVVREVKDADRYGAVHVDERGRVLSIGRVAGTVPAGVRSRLMFTGLQLLEPSVGDLLPDAGCIVRETYRKMIAAGRALHAVRSDAPWHEVSTIAEYLEANLDRARGRAVIDGAARLGEGVVLVAPCVVGRGASIAAGVRVARSVVWDGATLAESVENAIVTRRTILRV